MSRFPPFLFAIVCLLALIPPALAAQGGLAVKNVRIGDHGNGARIVLELSGPADYRVFHLADPPRLVVDLPPAAWRTTKNRFFTDRLLEGYRSGFLDDGLSRIIFDLHSPAVVTDAFAIPRSNMEPDRLVIDLTGASRNLFVSKLSDVFGNRALQGPGAPPAADSSFAQMENRLVREAAPRPPVAATEAPPPEARKTATERGRRRKLTVVVDAGHGGDDPGASGPWGIKEKNITLAIARELERELAEDGRYTVVMTRDRDVYIPLKERVEISRRVKGDLFISIHADKIARTGIRGASIYTLSERASDAETQRLADDENNSGVVAGVDLAAESEDVAGILLDLAMREKMNDSKVLSRSLETAFLDNNVRLLPNSHRSAGFAVLKAPDVPSVLIESGFLSNPEEAKLLATPQFQRRIAGAIATGADAYFRKMLALQKM